MITGLLGIYFSINKYYFQFCNIIILTTLDNCYPKATIFIVEINKNSSISKSNAADFILSKIINITFIINYYMINMNII